MTIGTMLAAVALAATVLTACGGDDDPVEGAQPSTTLSATTTEPPKPIVVKDFSFTGLEVRAGSKVLIQNEGPSDHTFTAEEIGFDTGIIAPGTNEQFTVPSMRGTYRVKCVIHPARMTGELKVT